MINDREIKEQIKALKKVKKGSRVKTALRHDLNKRIRDLEKKLTEGYAMTTEKEELIKKIYKAEPDVKKIKMDLRKFTMEELEYHYRKKCKKKGSRV